MEDAQPNTWEIRGFYYGVLLEQAWRFYFESRAPCSEAAGLLAAAFTPGIAVIFL